MSSFGSKISINSKNRNTKDYTGNRRTERNKSDYAAPIPRTKSYTVKMTKMRRLTLFKDSLNLVKDGKHMRRQMQQNIKICQTNVVTSTI